MIRMGVKESVTFSSILLLSSGFSDVRGFRTFGVFGRSGFRHSGFIFGRSGFFRHSGFGHSGFIFGRSGFSDVRGLDIWGSFSDVRGFRTFGVF